jgi:hypothetical protein
VATAAALATVAAGLVAVLGFVVGVFDDDGDEPAAADGPAITTLGKIPPSTIDAAGTSGPVSEENAIYLVARRLEDGVPVAAATADVSESSENEDVLRWHAVLDIGTPALGYAVKGEDRPVPYQVVAAVMPEGQSSDGGSSGGGPAVPLSVTTLSEDGIDLDAAESVSEPRVIRLR